MENFTGIFIASTNFAENLDKASIRRFNIKLEFGYLEPEGIIIFYRRMLKRLCDAPFVKVMQEELKNIKHLTPGDFKIVYQKHAFLPKEEVKHEDLIAALKEEVAVKNVMEERRIGF